MSFLFGTLRNKKGNPRRNMSSISCCSSSSFQASDDQTNGVKIVRKKNAPIDLTTDLVSLSNSAVSQRLKLILEKLENSDAEIPPLIISKNIQYALDLLQQEGKPEEKSSPTNESEEIVGSEIQDEILSSPVAGNEEGNELSQVDEEVIPEEVRQWLASTFTKNVPAKTRTEGRPRFRSVANAIRVGLFVDRFYRQQSSTTMEIPSDVGALLKEINNWQFDIFTLHEKSGNRSLRYVAKDLFSRYGLLSKFRINLDRLDNFLAAVETGYTRLTNPYHNDIHASDVTQTLHFFISSSGIVNLLTDLEIFSLLFAALIHDFEHTGRTNNFHINTATDLSLIYNDRSVLENHHVSAAFRLLRDDDKNILSGLKSEEYREFRNLVIEMVLSTDMSSHFTQLKTVKAILNGDRSINRTGAVMNLLLHCADISHPGKPWKLHKKFADLIIQEFFLQGDEECRLGLPFSPLCDRKSVLVPESQISFIEFIVEPSLGLMSDLIEFSISAEADGGGKAKVTRRADSDKSLMSDVRRRFSSSQGGPNKPSNGPILRPWINHLQENKAKWRMISAESATGGKINLTNDVSQTQNLTSIKTSKTTISETKEVTTSVALISKLTPSASTRRREFQSRLSPFTEEAEAMTTMSTDLPKTPIPSNPLKKGVKNSLAVRHIKEAWHSKEGTQEVKFKSPAGTLSPLSSKGLKSCPSSLPESLKGSFDSLRDVDERDIADVDVRKQSLRAGMFLSKRSSFDSPRPSSRGRIWERQSSSSGNSRTIGNSHIGNSGFPGSNREYLGSKENLHRISSFEPGNPGSLLENSKNRTERRGRGNCKWGNNGLRGRRGEERIKLLNKGKELSSSLPSLQDVGRSGILGIPAQFPPDIKTHPTHFVTKKPNNPSDAKLFEIKKDTKISGTKEIKGNKNVELTQGISKVFGDVKVSEFESEDKDSDSKTKEKINMPQSHLGNSVIPNSENNVKCNPATFRGRNYYRRGSFNRQLSNTGFGGVFVTTNGMTRDGRGGNYGRNRGSRVFGSPSLRSPGQSPVWTKPGEDNMAEAGESSGVVNPESTFLCSDQKPGNPKGNKGKSKRNAKK